MQVAGCTVVRVPRVAVAGVRLVQTCRLRDVLSRAIAICPRCNEVDRAADILIRTCRSHGDAGSVGTGATQVSVVLPLMALLVA
jgi:hypothetical protein